MADLGTYYGANYTVVDNLPAVASLVNACEWGGNVQVVTDTLTCGATDTGTAGSLIYIGKIPKHSIPLFTVVSSPAIISWTGIIGWANDTDCLGDFTTFSAAASHVCGPAAATANTKTTQDQNVYITIADAALIAGDSISTSIFYVNGG